MNADLARTESPAAPEKSGAAGAVAAQPTARDRLIARWWLPTVGTLAFLAIWELVARVGVLPEVVPPVTAVVSWLSGQLATAQLWSAISATLIQWAVGLLLAFVAGVAVGIAMGAIPLFRQLFEIPFEFFRPIPSVIYIPLVVLLIGSKSETAILLSFIAAVWPVLFNTFYGISDVDPVVRDTGRAFGLTGPQRLAYIIVPSILPYVATGLRIAASTALVVVVAVGLITGVPGIGQDMQVYAINGVHEGVYGLIVVTGVLGVLVNVGFQRLERSVLGWHVAYRTGDRE